ncbi:DUF2235 domain-containing protein [Dankookia rubra]|uniref:DUF2235 domain-containing protein n=1 Tax=Dankookia rubra TaxID=1442381 RepID=A0A4R5QLC5_9PROT|nr:DUF2235 domain-containing protein [Dankookia rubra]TDH64310.1 DUF2235 domain-containing protein [Dankookia rubra]
MGRKLIVFADGTGNAYGVRESNVWRLYQALDRSQPDQIARYVKGVGTSSLRPLALLDGATGFGVPSNIRELYRFLCWNWQEGDEIWAFGFSRGAFTVRSLIGLIKSEGLVPATIGGAAVTRAEMRRNAMAAWRAYRSNSPSWRRRWFTITATRWVRDRLLAAWHGLLRHRAYAGVRQATLDQRRTTPTVRFLGLFDTVEAYGVPIEALRSAIDRVVWPMTFRNRQLWAEVRQARHALALDEERVTFHPLLFDRQAEGDPDRIRELWFAGVHSDVGGGYPDDALAGVPLAWMAMEARQAGLRLRIGALDAVQAAASPFAACHDSRTGLGVFYRYGPRQVRSDGPRQATAPLVHHSVVEKIAYGTDAYAPVALPASAAVRLPDGQLVPLEDFGTHLPPDQRKALAKDQAQGRATTLTAAAMLNRPDRAITGTMGDLIWWRKLAYVLLFLATAGLVALPFLLGHPAPDAGWLTRIGGLAALVFAPVVEALRAVLPTWSGRWLDPFLEAPLIAGGLVLLAFGLDALGGRLRDTIAEQARSAWLPAVRQTVRNRPGARPRGLALRLARRLRNAGGLGVASRFLSRAVLPVVLLLALLAGVLLAAHRIGLAWRVEAFGLCVPTAPGTAEPAEFPTSDPCWASGRRVVRGERYRLRLEMTEAFRDQNRPSGIGGFRPAGWRHRLAAPFRRWSWGAAWFQPIARIGPSAGTEWALPGPVAPADPGAQGLVTEFVAPRDGELFLYVNDALPFGAGVGAFYGNNAGSARVTLERLPAGP